MGWKFLVLWIFLAPRMVEAGGLSGAEVALDGDSPPFLLNSVRISFYGDRGRWDHITLDPTPAELRWLIRGFRWVYHHPHEKAIWRAEFQQRVARKILVLEKFQDHLELTQKALGTKELQVEIRFGHQQFGEILRRLECISAGIEGAPGMAQVLEKKLETETLQRQLNERR